MLDPEAVDERLQEVDRLLHDAATANLEGRLIDAAEAATRAGMLLRVGYADQLAASLVRPSHPDS